MLDTLIFQAEHVAEKSIYVSYDFLILNFKFNDLCKKNVFTVYFLNNIFLRAVTAGFNFSPNSVYIAKHK